ncbi:MAG: T9SS type A sorting domain-containing protein [Bacteroidia bacterium]|nr:MAG: T9SS type A sorting domain-containing protein [Bacteroidia bacterium]
MKKLSITAMLVAFALLSFAAKKRVLFIGNSYTYVNDLPLMLTNVALSCGDSVEYDGNLIGGYTLQSHSTNTTTINKIKAGNWDYVVLQEQSQLPAFPFNQVQSSVLPYAKQLDSMIHAFNPCAETVFFMTWGYKNGDANNCASFPPICTYSGMDSLLRARYTMMADSNQALISPVGPVRRYIRNNYPSIELYDNDGSHPSIAGTYAAACTFYSILFKKSPLNITFNSTLSTTDASNIRTAAKLVAFDSLATWNIGKFNPKASYNYTINNKTVSFNNQSIGGTQYLWSFGDGSTSTLASPSHAYTSAGVYQVKLLVKKCALTDSITKTINITTTATDAVLSDEVVAYPIPFKTFLNIRMPVNLFQNLQVYSLTGSMLQLPVTKGNHELNVDFTTAAAGTYFIKIQIDNRTQLLRVIKQ